MFPSPAHSLTPSDLSAYTVSPSTASTSYDQISNPNRVEVNKPNGWRSLTSYLLPTSHFTYLILAFCFSKIRISLHTLKIYALLPYLENANVARTTLLIFSVRKLLIVSVRRLQWFTSPNRSNAPSLRCTISTLTSSCPHCNIKRNSDATWFIGVKQSVERILPHFAERLSSI